MNYIIHIIRRANIARFFVEENRGVTESHNSHLP